MYSTDLPTLLATFFGAWLSGYVAGTILRLFRQFGEKL